MLDPILAPSQVYSRRAEALDQSQKEAFKREGSLFRQLVVLAIVGWVITYQAWDTKKLPAWTPVVILPVALFLMRGLQANRSEARRTRFLKEYYSRAIARLSRDWEDLDEGADFRDPNHFYSTDLDLFGRGSLFQLLCSARTHAGRETLAEWMKAPAGREEVLQRRAAIAELLSRQDLRERLAAAGNSVAADCRPETFKSWLAEDSAPFPSWVPPVSFALSLAALALAPLCWSHILPMENFWLIAGGVALLHVTIIRSFADRVGNIVASVRLPSIELPILRELLDIVERETFTSPKLVELTDVLGKGTGRASIRMRKLGRLVQGLDLQDNPMFTLFSYGLLWRTQFSMAIDRWRTGHGRELIEWLRALGEIEALISLSAYAREHPGDVLPELLEGGPEFHAEGMGHPLLDENTCVRSDVHLDAVTRFFIVSGSNMSGKSTFLRSMGQNCVLAWMGAPVRCASLRISPLSLAAAIRLQDSLMDGRSHFFAEMKRLRDMIEAASQRPMLFLADEIMSGTNSQDRRIAAEWVIRALLLRGAIGAITTHDLALTEIAANGLPGANVHFEDTGEGGELHFDYTLRPGVLARSNALNIAHLLGIDTAAGIV